MRKKHKEEYEEYEEYEEEEEGFKYVKKEEPEIDTYYIYIEDKGNYIVNEESGKRRVKKIYIELTNKKRTIFLDYSFDKGFFDAREFAILNNHILNQLKEEVAIEFVRKIKEKVEKMN